MLAELKLLRSLIKLQQHQDHLELCVFVKHPYWIDIQLKDRRQTSLLMQGLFINDWGNIMVYWADSGQNEALANK